MAHYLGSNRVIEAARTSLKHLRLMYLDLYLLYWPKISPVGDGTDPPPHKTFDITTPNNHELEEFWQAMEALVRAIRVSNFSIGQIQSVLSFCKIAHTVYQGGLHPYWQQDELVNFCNPKGIHVVAHTPLEIPSSHIELVPKYSYCGNEDTNILGSSPFLSNQESQCVPSKVPRPRKKSVHTPMLRTTTISKISQGINKTAAQVILRWALQKGTTVLPHSLREDCITSNFDILNWSLSDIDWQVVNSLEPQRCQIEGYHSYLHENFPRALEVVVESDGKELAE